MKTRTNTQLKFKSESGMNMDLTISKGSTPISLIANILLVAPKASLEDIREYVNKRVDELTQNTQKKEIDSRYLF